MKCLIVEDVTYIREIYRYNLQSEPYEIVAESADGLDALKKIEAFRPDIVILDLILPLKNGLDVLKESHSLSPHSRFLVVSSMNEQNIIDQAKSLGAIEYLTKPFTREQLLSALSRISVNYSEVQNG